MGKITESMIEKAYEIAKKYYLETISLTEAKKELHILTGMPETSAQDYIYKFKHFMNGSLFERLLSARAIRYYLQNIYEDFGIMRVQKALIAIELHGDYLQSIGKTIPKVYIELLSKYQDIINTGLVEKEDEVLEIFEESGKSREELLAFFNERDFDKDVYHINGFRVKRDKVAIAIIKKLRNFRCQFCGKTIKKKNGSLYIEAAHIQNSCDGGKEIPENIILLCPNHHKEMDLGDSFTVQLGCGKIILSLNGEERKIDLSIS